MAAAPSSGDPPPPAAGPAPRPSTSSRKRPRPEGSGSRGLSVAIPAVAGGGNCRSFSQLLAGAMTCSPSLLTAPMLAVPCFLAPAGMLEAAAMTGPFLMSHQAVLATVTAQAQMHLQVSCQSPSSNSFPSPVVLQQQPVPTLKENNTTIDTSIAKQKFTDIVKTLTSDGYNWRKYGQKPAKQSESLRSYYRCTDANCAAKKKVAHCPDGRVTEVVYHGEHNHECPQKVKLSNAGELPGRGPVGKTENIETLIAEVDDSKPDLSKTAENSCYEATPMCLHSSSDREVEDGANTNKDVGKPDAKIQTSDSHIALSPTLCKVVREQKTFVEMASSAAVENDGYKWRKYGQKNIKGSLNPRSYYKCTHAGCPVRKHVERASDDAKTMHVTYEGKHNHEAESSKSEIASLPTASYQEVHLVDDAKNKLHCTSTPERPPVDRHQDAKAVDSFKLEKEPSEATAACTPCASTSRENDVTDK